MMRSGANGHLLVIMLVTLGLAGFVAGSNRNGTTLNSPGKQSGPVQCGPTYVGCCQYGGPCTCCPYYCYITQNSPNGETSSFSVTCSPTIMSPPPSPFVYDNTGSTCQGSYCSATTSNNAVNCVAEDSYHNCYTGNGN